METGRPGWTTWTMWNQVRPCGTDGSGGAADQDHCRVRQITGVCGSNIKRRSREFLTDKRTFQGNNPTSRCQAPEVTGGLAAQSEAGGAGGQ